MAAVEVTPGSELIFKLSQHESTPKTAMTLRHPGGTNEALAFKVKTTQPRRYLVRPNQGLIKPGSSETVQIILVEKDKQMLWQSYQRLGQSALDHSKDKFLVQSTPVDAAFAEEYADLGEAGYDKLSSMWASATSTSSSMAIANKKLHVKHVVDGAGTVMPPKHESANVKDMNEEQLVAELTNLRRKYDELVAFSVNLTAERDILNNTLEQTKRDLNREMTKSAAAANRSTAGGGASAAKAEDSSRLFFLLIVAVVFFIMGVRLETMGKTGFFKSLPVVGGLMDGEL